METVDLRLEHQGLEGDKVVIDCNDGQVNNESSKRRLSLKEVFQETGP
jgi:peptide subunit release factor 1 (eRF1)